MKLKSIVFIILIGSISNLFGKRVQYEFDINEKQVEFTGKPATALAIGGQIPAPVIEATVGDILEVTFNNKMDEETSIHWHGILLPNDQDGVPYLTTSPIYPHTSFTYKFEVKHPGTYWYHSHTDLQEQRGIYGPLVFHPQNGEKIQTDYDYTVVLSDWSDESPNTILSNLKKDGDYYALKKRNVQSWLGVLKNGPVAIKNRLRGAWSRMGTMDLSDIGYDTFLTNGSDQSELKAHAGSNVRIRLINASASTYFNVEFSGEPMTIVSADGIDVEPIKVKRLLVAIAETYDIIIHTPEDQKYELRATAVDGTGYSSTFIGSGKEELLAPDIPKPNLYLGSHGAHTMGTSTKAAHKKSMAETHSHMHQAGNMDENIQGTSVIEYMDNYDHLEALEETTSGQDRPLREVTLNLTGNMERYVWSFNNKTLLESSKILVRKGETVRFVLKNQTMMQHPIHLHGHFFRVINGQGSKNPLKHTVNVPSMEEIVIEFEADEEKDWFFHCHNLYHMKAGMARSVSYQETSTATRQTFKKLSSDKWYYFSDIAALSNMTMGILWVANTRNSIEVEYDYNYEKEYDTEIIYARNFTRYFDAYGGINPERKDKDETPEVTAIAGVRYVLPLLIESNLRINSEADVRLQLNSSLQLTDRLQFEWLCNTDKEYRFTFSYEINKKVLISTTYDSDFHWGVGLRVKL